jgi:hypothetical protein
MSYTILVGPTLALNPKQSRIYSVVDDTFNQLATIEVTAARTLILRISDIQPIDGILYFVTVLAKQFKNQTIIATDEDAVTLVAALSDTVGSSDEIAVTAWTNLNFEVTAVRDTNSVSPAATVRFVGTNIAGLKQIVSASSIKMTITAK